MTLCALPQISRSSQHSGALIDYLTRPGAPNSAQFPADSELAKFLQT
jgi:hypothetical protein